MAELRNAGSRAGRRTGWLWRAAYLAPLVLPAALAAFGSVAVLFILLGQFKSAYVWPLGLLAAMLACVPVVRARKGQSGSVGERNVCDLLVLIGVSVWILFNVLFTAQHFLTNRDPGIYTTAGAWLVKHDSLKIPATDAFKGTPSVVAYSGGFSQGRDPSTLDAQGQHLLPALLGLSGRIVGVSNMVRINVLIGGIALLAIYGFARELVRPRWALIAAGTVSLALPMLYFSRDTYTEPLAAAFTFGALALIWLAQVNKNRWLWLVAGAVAGAGALTRVDAYLTLAALAAFLVVKLALSAGAARKRDLADAAAFAAGAGAIGVLGFLDISRLSASYYTSQTSNIRHEFLLLALIIVAGAVLVAVGWKTDFLKWLDNRTRSWRAQAIWVVVVAVALVLASRPFWYVGHGIASAVIVNGKAVTGPGRSYSEQTVNWLVWYLGPVMTALGGLGLAYAAGIASRRRDLLMLPALFVIGGTALVYLINPSIFPDQIWASRRMLPVILPGIAVFGALALERLYSHRQLLRRNIHGKTVATVLATLAFVGPLFVSLPFLKTREDAWYPPVQAVCDKAPKNAAILWVGTARARFVEPAQALCGVASEGYGTQIFGVKGIDRDALATAAKEARANGFEPIVGVYGQEAGLLKAPARLTDVSDFSYRQIESTFTTPPRLATTQIDSIWLGTINQDGSVAPLSSP